MTAPLTVSKWAFSHPEIYNVEIQVIAVFCVSGRWIPVVLTPWGQTVRIASYDANAVLPAALLVLPHPIGQCIGIC